MASFPKGKRTVLLTLTANTQQTVTCEADLPNVELSKEGDATVWFTTDNSDVVIPAAGESTGALPIIGAVGSVQLPPRSTGGTILKFKSTTAATVYVVDPGR